MCIEKNRRRWQNSSYADVREALLDLSECVYVCALKRERGKSQSQLIRYRLLRTYVTDGISDVTGKPGQGTKCKMKRKQLFPVDEPGDCTVLGGSSFAFESRAENEYRISWNFYTKYIKWTCSMDVTLVSPTTCFVQTVQGWFRLYPRIYISFYQSVFRGGLMCFWNIFKITNFIFPYLMFTGPASSY